VLARHAEDLFWIGRYLERAEDTARMLDVTYHGLLESSVDDSSVVWRELVKVLHLEQAFDARGIECAEAPVSEFLALDDRSGGSIVASIACARDNARTVRERISTELWEAINTLHLELRARDLRADLQRQPYELYRIVKARCQMITGVAAETMPRDDGWRFLVLGRMLERAEMTCRLLSVRWVQRGSPDPQATYQHWGAVLKSVSAFEAYVRVHHDVMGVEEVLEFLLLSREFPRGVLFCLRSAEDQLARLGTGDRPIPPHRLLGRMRATLEYLDVPELVNDGLQRFLDQLQEGIWQVADAVSAHFFQRGAEHELHSLGAF
jgi:uncharacterized alpha-E superfamily protein